MKVLHFIKRLLIGLALGYVYFTCPFARTVWNWAVTAFVLKWLFGDKILLLLKRKLNAYKNLF